MADGASDALRLCRAETPRIDLLLSDVVMPGTSGPALAELLIAVHPDLRVLFMSGYTDEAVSRTLLDSGAAFLQKPFTPDVLSKKIRDVLATSSHSQGPVAPSKTVLPNGEIQGTSNSLETNSSVSEVAVHSNGVAPTAVTRGRRGPASASKAAPANLTGRVLVVDDVAEYRRAYARVLESAGLQVDVASEGASASEKVKAGYDVVVSDITMPGLDGIELLRRIRQFDIDVPVILVTGHPEVETAMKAVELGAFKYLSKPVPSQVLLTTIQEALQLHRLARLKRDALGLLGDLRTDVGERSVLRARFDLSLQSMWMAFQPIVSSSEKKTIAFECLLRSDETTMSSPAAILDAAERLGLLHDLGRRIRAQCAVAAKNPAASCLFVNLHASDLLDDDLYAPGAPLLEAILEKRGAGIVRCAG